MNKSNSDGCTLKILHARKSRSNIYDRISRMAELIGGMKSELAHEKELLNIEKIKSSYYNQNYTRPNSNAHIYQHPQQTPKYVPYEGPISPSQKSINQYEAQRYYQNMYPKMYFSNMHNKNSDTFPVAQQPSEYTICDEFNNLDINLLADLDLTESEQKILDNERRNIQQKSMSFKRRSLEIDRQCSNEDKKTKKHMYTLYRGSDQILPMKESHRNREYHRRHEENDIRYLVH